MPRPKKVVSEETKSGIALKVKNHPEFSEILSKLIIAVDVEQIHEWLKAKYENAGDKSLIISKANLIIFKDEYLDFYNQVSEDLAKIASGKELSSAGIEDSIQNNTSYRQRLSEYLDEEINVKEKIKNLVIAIEARAIQVFDQIQDDPRNMRNDRVLIEWFNLLFSTLEKYETIINGSPQAAFTQNNINIQIVDQHINSFHKVIREVLARFDIDTSMLFIDLFNDEMNKLKDKSEQSVPVSIRLDETNKLSEETNQLLTQ